MRLVLFAADSGISKAVDLFSGGDGFSHVALDLGDGMLFDVSLERGAHLRPLSDYAGRPRAYVDVGDSGFARARVVRLLGRPFELRALGRAGNGGALNCTSAVLHVLPAWVLERVVTVCDDASRCRPISPNDVAAAFGMVPAQLFAAAE